MQSLWSDSDLVVAHHLPSLFSLLSSLHCRLLNTNVQKMLQKIMAGLSSFPLRSETKTTVSHHTSATSVSLWLQHVCKKKKCSSTIGNKRRMRSNSNKLIPLHQLVPALHGSFIEFTLSEIFKLKSQHM